MSRINTDTKWKKYASNKQIGSKQYIYTGWPMLTFEWMSFKEKEVFLILDENHDCSKKAKQLTFFPGFVQCGWDFPDATGDDDCITIAMLLDFMGTY